MATTAPSTVSNSQQSNPSAGRPTVTPTSARVSMETAVHEEKSVEDPADNGDLESLGTADNDPHSRKKGEASRFAAFMSRTGQFLISRRFLKVLKASLAYVLGFMWVFYDTTSVKLQARVASQIFLAVVVITPAHSTGKFFDEVAVNLSALFFAAAGWALINSVAGSNEILMSILLFIIVYLFSYIRSIDQRYFGVGVVGPLLAFTACTSTTGVNGPNTTNGQVFDSNYLLNTLYAFLLGGSISIAVNVFIFPESAERDLKTHLKSTLSSLSLCLSLITEPFTPNQHSPESNAHRATAIAKLKSDIAAARKCLSELDAELFFSRLAVQDYEQALKKAEAMASQVYAIHSSLLGHETSVMGTRVFKTVFSRPMTVHLSDVENSLRELLDQVQHALEPRWKPTHKDSRDAVTARTGRIRDGLKQLEKKQFEVIYNILYGVGDITPRVDTPKVDDADRGTVALEGIAQVNYFTLGLIEVVDQLESLVLLVTDATRKRKWRFHYKHFAFGRLFSFQRVSADPASILAPPKNPTVRYRLKKVADALMARESIFSLKVAIAVLIYLLICFNQPWTYQNWYFSTAFITLVVAVSPNIGQANLSLLLNLGGSLIGQTWAYVALTAWGVGQNPYTLKCYGWGCNNPTWLPRFGLALFGLLLAIPMNHIYLNTKFSGLGLLALLTYTAGVLPPYFNRINPFYDSPWVRYYKIVTVLVGVIAGAMVLQLLLYPNIARHVLRTTISQAIRRLSVLYADVYSSAFQTEPKEERTQLPKQILDRQLDRQNDLQILLSSLEPLMLFSTIEFRLEGRFQRQEYREIITRLNHMADRLESARISLGGHSFEASIVGMLSPSLLKARKELVTTVRLLLYIMASSILSKHPLPSEMPRVTPLRNKIFQSYNEMLSEYLGANGNLRRAPSVRSTGESKFETPSIALEVPGPSGSMGSLKKRTSGSMFFVTPLTHDQAEIVPSNAEEFHKIIRSESWMRFLSFAIAIRMFATELDALIGPMKTLFGEMPETEVGSVIVDVEIP